MFSLCSSWLAVSNLPKFGEAKTLDAKACVPFAKSIADSRGGGGNEFTFKQANAFAELLSIVDPLWQVRPKGHVKGTATPLTYSRHHFKPFPGEFALLRTTLPKNPECGHEQTLCFHRPILVNFDFLGAYWHHIISGHLYKVLGYACVTRKKRIKAKTHSCSLAHMNNAYPFWA